MPQDPRLLMLPTRQALAWRWELAQLELGCRFGWPQPGARIWAARARRIGVLFETHRGMVVLAFEGYTLVGALWSRGERALALSGPFVMPQFRATQLPDRLRTAFLQHAVSEAADKQPIATAQNGLAP
jgi:hypothetical protein